MRPAEAQGIPARAGTKRRAPVSSAQLASSSSPSQGSPPPEPASFLAHAQPKVCGETVVVGGFSAQGPSHNTFGDSRDLGRSRDPAGSCDKSTRDQDARDTQDLEARKQDVGSGEGGDEGRGSVYGERQDLQATRSAQFDAVGRMTTPWQQQQQQHQYSYPPEPTATATVEGRPKKQQKKETQKQLDQEQKQQREREEFMRQANYPSGQQHGMPMGYYPGQHSHHPPGPMYPGHPMYYPGNSHPHGPQQQQQQQQQQQESSQASSREGQQHLQQQQASAHAQEQQRQMMHWQMGMHMQAQQWSAASAAGYGVRPPMTGYPGVPPPHPYNYSAIGPYGMGYPPHMIPQMHPYYVGTGGQGPMYPGAMMPNGSGVASGSPYAHREHDHEQQQEQQGKSDSQSNTAKGSNINDDRSKSSMQRQGSKSSRSAEGSGPREGRGNHQKTTTTPTTKEPNSASVRTQAKVPKAGAGLSAQEINSNSSKFSSSKKSLTRMTDEETELEGLREKAELLEQRNAVLKYMLRTQGEEVNLQESSEQACKDAENELTKLIERQRPRPRKIRRSVGKLWNLTESFGVQSQAKARSHLFMLEATRNSVHRLDYLLELVSEGADGGNGQRTRLWKSFTKSQRKQLFTNLDKFKELRQALALLVEEASGVSTSYDQSLQAFAQFLHTLKTVIRPEQLGRAMNFVKLPHFPATALETMWRTTLEPLEASMPQLGGRTLASGSNLKSAPYAASEGEHLLIEARAHVLEGCRKHICEGVGLPQKYGFTQDVDLFFKDERGQSNYHGVEQVQGFLGALRRDKYARCSEPRWQGDFAFFDVVFGKSRVTITYSFSPGKRQIFHVEVCKQTPKSPPLWRASEDELGPVGMENVYDGMHSGLDEAATLDIDEAAAQVDPLPSDYSAYGQLSSISAGNDGMNHHPMDSRPHFTDSSTGMHVASSTRSSNQHATPKDSNMRTMPQNTALDQERRYLMHRMEAIFHAHPDIVQHFDANMFAMDEVLGQEFRGVDSFLGYLHGMNRKLRSFNFRNIHITSEGPSRYQGSFLVTTTFSDDIHLNENGEETIPERDFHGLLEVYFQEGTTQITQLYIRFSPVHGNLAM